jgi:CheY-like chemotaxis protein
MSIARVLLVDDDEVVRLTVQVVLENSGFHVTAASSVPEALKHISSEEFDVLLSDLHMPGAGDGLTVVSAMRHANPRAITLLHSAFPEMDAAANAIMLQADRIMVKPMNIDLLIETIKHHLEQGPTLPHPVETVATILERTVDASILDWLARVHREDTVMAIPMSDEVRSGHLPQLFRDLVHRLRSFKALGTKEFKSTVASTHGATRWRQGYTAEMMVEESRMLQVSIFQALQDNLATIDFSILLISVMSIADEVDSQLSQAMASYIAESRSAELPKTFLSGGPIQNDPTTLKVHPL